MVSTLYIVALTGASGVVYGKRFLEVLLSNYNCKIKLLISQPAEKVLELEMGWKLKGDTSEKNKQLHKLLGFSESDSKLEYIDYYDLAGPLCSGSFLSQGLIIIPCSMATLAGVAHGLSRNLIERTADVMLKESRPLILVPRETPLNEIHLQNMLTLKKAGAHIIPPMPAFYHNPQKISDLVDFVVGKVLDVMGLEHNLYKRWGSG